MDTHVGAARAFGRLVDDDFRDRTEIDTWVTEIAHALTPAAA